MFNKQNITLSGVLLALLLGVIGLIGGNTQSVPQSTNLLGGMTNLDGLTITPVDSGDGLKIGSSGDLVAAHEFSTCAPTFSSADMIATSSAIGICTDSSFTTSDKVLATQRFTGATTGLPTEGLFPALSIIATTTGQFGILVTNYTGAASTSINAIYRTYSYQLER